MEDRPALETFADLSSSGSATLPLGDSLEPAWRSARETLFLEQLQRAVAQVINPNLIEFYRAAPGQADLRIDYRVVPQGNLYDYEAETKSPAQEHEERAFYRSTGVQGLFRGYDVIWEVVLESREGWPVRWRTVTPVVPMRSYLPHPEDPEWAPYAVVLHARFLEVSNQVIQGMGFPAQAAPERYTFRDLLPNEDRSRESTLQELPQLAATYHARHR